MSKHIVVVIGLSLAALTGLANATFHPRDERADLAAYTSPANAAADRFCILFLDIGGIADAEDYAEGKLLARTLRYKLEFDYTYLDAPEMSRVYPAVDQDHVLGPGVDTRALMERARKVDLVTEMLSGAKQFVELIAQHRPNVVHVLAHGAGKGEFERGGWGDHGGEFWSFAEIEKALAGAKLDLGSVCLVTPGCDLGRQKILDGLRSLGFGAVIAWPGGVCVHEAFEFDDDLYEALVSQFILQRGPQPFWEFADGCPRALQKSFDFALESLRDRYRLLDEHFADVVGKKDVAGYYLHTPSWFGGHYEYAATPVMSCASPAPK